MEYYIDASLAINGDGSIATPWNILDASLLDNGDRVWIRRTGETSPVATTTVNLASLSGVELVGWPKVGEYLYNQRDVSLASWDSDTEDYWVVELTSNISAIVAVNSSYTYVSRLLARATLAGYYTLPLISLGNNNSFYKCKSIIVSSNGYNTTSAFTLDGSSPRLVDCIGYLSHTNNNNPTNSIRINNSTEDIRCPVVANYIAQYDNNNISHYIITYNTGSTSRQSCGFYDISCQDSIGNDLTTPLYLYSNVNSNMNPLNSSYINLNLGSANKAVFTAYSANDSQPKNITLTLTAGLVEYINGHNQVFPYKASTIHIRTDNMLSFHASLSNIVVNPITSTSTTEVSGFSNNSYSKYSCAKFSKVSNALPLPSSDESVNLSSTTDLNVWSIANKYADAVSTDVVRVGGAALSLLIAANNTNLLPGSSNFRPVLYLGDYISHIMRLELNPGEYDISIHGADKYVTWEHPSIYRYLVVYWCDSTGHTVDFITKREDDSSSVWVNDTGLTQWKYKYHLETDDNITLYARMVYMDSYLVDKITYLDPKIEYTNLDME